LPACWSPVFQTPIKKPGRTDQKGLRHGATQTCPDAALAGTTASTVSKVINGRPGVSEPMRERVNALLEQINYSKRPARHPRSRTVMIVCSNLSQPWVPDLLKGALRYAESRGMTVAITGRDVGNTVYIRAIERAHPFAVLFDSSYIPMEDRRVCDRLQIAYSALSLDGSASQEVDEYRIDDWRTGFIAGQYLMGLGHKRMAVIAGPNSVPCNAARVNGFRSALGREHLALPSRWIRFTDGWMEAGRKAALELLSDPEPIRPTAVFSTSDTQAIGVLSAARQLNIDVPSRLSLLGCDDIRSDEHVDPPLTTFRHPVSQMVSDAFRRMELHGQEFSSSPAAPQSRVSTYEARLIPRGSCATAPSRAGVDEIKAV
jgi:DNA-binding LacI/PurR family transcriptional regulator